MKVGVVAALVVVALAAAQACDQSLPPAPVCHDIPSGGCPIGLGDPCTDPTCSAAYECMDNATWRLDHACPASTDAGSSVDAGDAASDARDAAAARDVAIDVPGAYGGPGCVDLEMPDCPVGVAAACANCCGCEDLFVCQDGGWNAWGVCADGGISPR